MTRITIKQRLFVLFADGYSFTFTEPRSADKDYTINNEEELVGTIDDIVDGWQPKVQR